MTEHGTQPAPETGRRVDRLDGNAAGGPLSEIFGIDLTDAVLECRHCGQVAILASTVVELDPDGLVIICRGCRHQLLSYVHAAGSKIVRFQHLAGLIISETE